MKKVTIIGAGNVGATAAMNIARIGICDTVVLLDIKEGVAEGKAMDISQTLSILGVPTKVIGVTNDYSATENSDIYIITSGVPRKPGMTREELFGVNSKVVTSVMEGLSPYCNFDYAIFIVVSNPMDSMCMCVKNYVYKKFGLDANDDTYNDRIIGMGGILDSNRFKYYIKEALEKAYSKSGVKMVDNVNITDITGYVVGGHGDTTMIPVYEDARYLSYPITDLLMMQDIIEIVDNTMKGGATLTKMLGTSAWEAPAAGIATMVKAILNNEHKVLPCSAYGHPYGCFIGQLVKLGENGIEDYDWRYETIKRIQDKLFENAKAIKKVNESLT